MLLAEARGGHAVAPAEACGEVGGVAVAHPAHDIADGKITLGEQLRRGGHTPRDEFFVETALAELCIRSLQLTRRAAQRARHRGDRKVGMAVLARDDHPRKQVQPAALAKRPLTGIRPGCSWISHGNF